MRKHPVILGLLLLLLVFFVFFLLAYFLGVFTGKRSLPLADTVGVLTVEGVLRSSQDFARQAEEFGRDDGIKAVVVRIDSPGGGVAAGTGLPVEPTDLLLERITDRVSLLTAVPLARIKRKFKCLTLVWVTSFEPGRRPPYSSAPERPHQLCKRTAIKHSKAPRHRAYVRYTLRSRQPLVMFVVDTPRT